MSKYEPAKPCRRIQTKKAAGKTHYHGCWRDYGHHECAICWCWRLADALAEAVDILGALDLAARSHGKADIGFIRPLVLQWHQLIKELEERAADERCTEMAEE